MKKTAALTPLMAQYYEMKRQHPEAILLFRVGDFYEMYGDDAVRGAQALGITLTVRGRDTDNETEMAGFPYHSLDNYLPKLVRAGMRVAICDQLEDPKFTKKLVKRGITELVTPGVSTRENILNNKENNFLGAVHFDGAGVGLALLDLSTGEFFVAEGKADYITKLVSNFAPKEVLFERTKHKEFQQTFGANLLSFAQDDWIYTSEAARDRLLKQFETNSLKGFGVEGLSLAIIAAGATLYYMDSTHHERLGHITSIARIDADKYVWLDRFTVRNLELFAGNDASGKTLFDVIDKTATSMGGRLLRRWLALPLKEVEAINERLEVVDYFYQNPELQQEILPNFSQIGDLERLVSKVAVGRVTPRDVWQLRQALAAIAPIKEVCQSSGNENLAKIAEQIDLLQIIKNRIEKIIHRDPPAQLNKGNVINDGVDEELDTLRRISSSGKDLLLEVQQRESENTGIPSLKVSYNNVFGYYIEVRNNHRHRVPDTWIRKQTLTQAERYITRELKEYEDKILGAQEKILEIENRIFLDLTNFISNYLNELQRDCALLSQIDCLLAFARVAENFNYVRPTIFDDDKIEIKQGRHPVIERRLGIGQEYVPNDITLDNERQQIMIITGPNMAGKSALLRQTALIVLLAQIGCFVPAQSARIGIVDKIFTRVGASDNISSGESTFMVEMNEAASILNNITPRSLVLFDELGRGTSTYDGISIAWAIVEHLHETPSARAKTLFATHYHELSQMDESYKRVHNFNVSVKEVNDQVVFLRKLEKGASLHSYGIHVAKIAGMPKSIVKRAGELLEKLEDEYRNSPTKNSKPLDKNFAAHEGTQLSFFQLDDPVLESIRDEINNTDLDNLTPIEALNKLNEIKKIITGK